MKIKQEFKAVKATPPVKGKLSKKDDRKAKVLIGVVDHYIKTGKPVGSDTLKNHGFEALSSATIRNYFSHLEEEGFLIQAHTSGGRIPTEKGYRAYAEECLNNYSIKESSDESFKTLKDQDTKEIAKYLDEAINHLSQITNTAVFLSTPRFDQDFVVEIKLIPIDHERALAIIITDFGIIQTEVLHPSKKLNSFSAKRIESYFHFRLRGLNPPENLDPEEEEMAQKFYNELIVRFIVSYTNFSERQIVRTGFSKLLSYPDFQDTTILANSLSLFENIHSCRLLLKECSKQQRLKFWIREDLSTYTKEIPECTVIAIPYYINNQSVGAIGLLGPMRIPYSELFELLHGFSNAISKALTRNIYKYKINFRQPEHESLDLQKVEKRLISHSHFMLLENQISGEVTDD